MTLDELNRESAKLRIMQDNIRARQEEVQAVRKLAKHALKIRQCDDLYELLRMNYGHLQRVIENNQSIAYELQQLQTPADAEL